MDKEKALQILQLDADATLAQAKQSFRRLAKLYHPDVCTRQDKARPHADDRMAQINLAYKYLAPLLVSKASAAADSVKGEAPGHDVGREKRRPAREKSNPARTGIKKKEFSSTLDDLFAFFFRKANRPSSGKKTGPAKTQSKPGTRTRGSHRVNPGGRSGINPRRPKVRPARFNDVFSHLKAASSNGMAYRQFVSKGTGRIRSSRNFQACMALKRRINQVRARRSSGEGRISRVEPVTPVNPIEKS